MAVLDIAEGLLLNLRVWSSIGHRQEERTVVLQLEVLVWEFFTIDRFTASTLCTISVSQFGILSFNIIVLKENFGFTDITTSEVTTLQHELRDDTMELALLKTKSLFSSAKSSEIFGSSWDYIIVEVEIDATSLSYITHYISNWKLKFR